jgi:hypothetical protein
MIIFFAEPEEGKSSIAGITHRIRFYVFGAVLLVDSVDDWAGSDEDDGGVQHFGVESEMEPESPTQKKKDNGVLA